MNVAELNSYFQKNRESIIKDNMGRFAVIYNANVKGYFPSDKEALLFCSREGYKLGEFIIKQCLKEEDETQRFYSRVCFA